MKGQDSADRDLGGRIGGYKKRRRHAQLAHDIDR